MSKSKELSNLQSELIRILKTRFEKNMNRHEGLSWDDIEEKLTKQPHYLDILQELEDTDGEPDVVNLNKDSLLITFVDCSAESPKGRRSYCYDPDALASRKEHKPKDSAIGHAKSIGVKLLTEEEYFTLQSFGPFDLKTSSWLSTTEAVRENGGAIFGDHRYGSTFIYHNGAESYYAARGYRAKLELK